MNKSVDTYFRDGCGRCPLGATPGCKVHSWTSELIFLREVVLGCGLVEEAKWGAPCYTFQHKNILMISALREYCCISFFKGSLLSDNKKLLQKPGPYSQAARLFKFKSLKAIQNMEIEIRAYIFEAIELERAGLSVPCTEGPEPIPGELATKFIEDPLLKAAFEALSPGKQRGYIIYFTRPKQVKTRISRIEKAVPMILSGKGLHDKYRSSKK